VLHKQPVNENISSANFPQKNAFHSIVEKASAVQGHNTMTIQQKPEYEMLDDGKPTI
jgi:hypothetical protein